MTFSLFWGPSPESCYFCSEVVVSVVAVVVAAVVIADCGLCC